jgi:hypothetical protein
VFFHYYTVMMILAFVAVPIYKMKIIDDELGEKSFLCRCHNCQLFAFEPCQTITSHQLNSEIFQSNCLLIDATNPFLIFFICHQLVGIKARFDDEFFVLCIHPYSSSSSISADCNYTFPPFSIILRSVFVRYILYK